MAREKHVDDMTDDEVFARWLTRIEPIRHELKWLYASRRQFRAVTEMFETNPQLNAIGGRVFEWLKEMWIHDTVINVRRELDDTRNVESFGVLLDEALKRPQVLTRRRFVDGIAETDFRWELLNDKFTALGIIKSAADSMDDYLAPANISADRKGLNRVADSVLAFADRAVAHRTPGFTNSATFKDLNDAIDSIEPVFKKYFEIINGNSFDLLDRPLDSEWAKPFEFAWLIPPPAEASDSSASLDV